MLKSRLFVMFLALSLFFLITGPELSNSSRIPTIQWTKTYGGAENNACFSVLPTAEGGFLLVGSKHQEKLASWNLWLVKTDGQGEMQWEQTYGNTETDIYGLILQTAEGGFLLVGLSINQELSTCDVELVKIDAQGVIQWNHTYGGYILDAFSLLPTFEGGFLLAGTTESYGAGKSDMWLVKMDAQGAVQWNQTYGGPNYEEFSSASTTADGGFLLAGTTASYGAGDSDMWAVRTDAQGVVQWNQTYGGAEDDLTRSALLTSDWGFLLAGTTRSFGSGRTDMWLVKADAQGEVQWNQTYGSWLDSEQMDSVLPTLEGGFLLVGSKFHNGESSRLDRWVVKVDAQGVMQWNQTYWKSAYERIIPVLPTAEGGFLFAGTSTSYGTSDSDIRLTKTDAQGVVQWNQTYGGAEDDSFISAFATADGGYLLVGTTESYGAGGSDIWLVKLHFSADTDNKLSGIAVISLVFWGSAVLLGLAAFAWLMRQKMLSHPKIRAMHLL